MSVSLLWPLLKSYYLSGNSILVRVGGIVPAGATDYRVLLRISSTDAKLIGAPFTDAKPLNGASAVFDIAGYLNQPINKAFEWPIYNPFNLYDSHIYGFKLQPGERYIDSNGNLQEVWGTLSTTFYCLNGGLGYQQLGIYNETYSDFYAEYIADMKFLTWMPDVQIVRPYQPSKLWIVREFSQSLLIAISAVYDDGSTVTSIKTANTTENNIVEINAIPALFDPVNLLPVKGGSKMLYFDAIVQYDVQGGADHIIKRFIVDHNYHESCSYLFFVNSIGGIDTVWLSGAIEKGFSVESVYAIKPWVPFSPIYSTSRASTSIVSSKTGRRTWKINTGYKSSEEMEALADLLLSKEVWLLEKAGSLSLDINYPNEGALYPVIIKNSQEILHDNMQDLNELTLEIEEAHTNEYF